jgi:Cytidylate kinase-like family
LGRDNFVRPKPTRHPPPDKALLQSSGAPKSVCSPAFNFCAGPLFCGWLTLQCCTAAMTREMATLGKDVAAGLAERLGLTVVHHELVKQGIAERAGMRESEVHRFLEGESSLLARWKIDRKRLSRYTAALG